MGGIRLIFVDPSLPTFRTPYLSPSSALVAKCSTCFLQHQVILQLTINFSIQCSKGRSLARSFEFLPL